jgi:CBS domain-containing protein
LRENVDAAVAGGQPALTVGELLGPDAAQNFAIPASAPLEDLLGSEPLARLGALMVVDEDGRLTGVVTIDQVRRALASAAPARVA